MVCWKKDEDKAFVTLEFISLPSAFLIQVRSLYVHCEITLSVVPFSKKEENKTEEGSVLTAAWDMVFIVKNTPYPEPPQDPRCSLEPVNM